MVRVEAAGFLTTIQDLGRKGYGNVGVPVSGVMDLYSAKIANLMLQNSENDAVLEITFGNCTLVFEKETVICISGADFSATINNQLVVLNSVLKINKNDVLKFRKRNYGVRTYIAILGGFKTKKFLKSRSFYINITKDSVLKKGDLLPYKSYNKKITSTLSTIKPNILQFNKKTIECFKGPEYILLSELQKKNIINTLFSISNANNRMAYLLNELIENTLESMLTSAVLPGTVQLTPSGKLIILMRDCQVTGGYPRILQLTPEAINIISQKTTHDSFKFKLI